ncbi:MAG: sugar ABC transporter permease [Oscillospiraceae bacterium]|nr:sugar ABC transporter permease [Oscillospiraceae bacterium]
MKKEIMGSVVSVKKQWWLKINTKPVRMGALDGAVFPHIARIAYTVDGVEYVKRKWIGAGAPVPTVGSAVKVVYDEDAPSKADLEF